MLNKVAILIFRKKKEKKHRKGTGFQHLSTTYFSCKLQIASRDHSQNPVAIAYSSEMHGLSSFSWQIVSREKQAVSALLTPAILKGTNTLKQAQPLLLLFDAKASYILLLISILLHQFSLHITKLTSRNTMKAKS